MNFSVGQEVRVKRTGEIGEIIEVHLDGMLLLDLDGDDIPVAKEDVEPYHPEYEAYYPKPNATLARAHQLHPEVIKGRQAITHKGVLLAFETRYDDEGSLPSFARTLSMIPTEMSYLTLRSPRLRAIEPRSIAYYTPIQPSRCMNCS